MTILFNLIFAGILCCTGLYHLWVGNLTDALMLFALVLILHNAAGGYRAAKNTVVIYRLLVDTKRDVEAIDKRTKYMRNRLFTEQER